MNRNVLRAAVLLLAGALVAGASSYRDFADRPIKSMPPERMAALQSGAGAGYALPAELNGYPGPRHVLELAEGLGLTPEQRHAAEMLFAEMKAEAVPLGRTLIEREAAIEALFRAGEASETALFALTAEAGTIEASLRATHLKYHLRMAALLSPHQRQLYNRLRGYAEVPDHGHRH